MAAQTSAGYTLSIGTTAANPSGDSYTLIGEITNIGAFGKQFQMIEHKPVSDRETQQFKGSFTRGNIQIDLAMDVGDSGQDALLDALDSDSLYNFLLEYNDAATSGGHGSQRRFKARVTQYNETPGGVDNIITAQAMLAIQSVFTRIAAT